MLLNSDRIYTKFVPQMVIYKNNPMRLLMYRGFATVKKTIRLVEVGPRDGLQNEKIIVPTDTKIALVNKLTNAGLDHIEVSSFVNPKWVPQLADALQVFQQIRRNPNTKYSALVPNTKGMLRAVEARPDEVAIFAAASETFSKRNINCSIGESLKRFDEVLKLAKHYQIPVRGYISCVLGCPYEKSISPDAVARVTSQLWERGCYEVSLGDTIGVGTPESMDRLLSVLLNRVGVCPREAIAVHCHETGGKALENISVALDRYGVRVVDSAVGGLGGCPYAGPGAPGNVSTEAVLTHLTNKGYTFSAPINTAEIFNIGSWIRGELSKLTSKH
ncbi:hypothetical protein AHF37_08297 [Paragonimus kellicotti]|nr:hypothetical protein AHF37_08297 [Paragonimus kellicotti]